MKRLTILLLFIITSISAQERKTLFGKVMDSIDVVKNANIINLQTRQGTFSNDYGDFKIFAKIGDSLRVSSIQYETKIYVVNKVSFGFNDVYIFLKRKTYELDEISLEKNKLSGYLDIDKNSVPTDRRDSLMRKTLDFSKVDMSKKLDDDHIDQKVRPPIVKTDQSIAFATAGATIGFAFKHSEKLWRLRRELAFKRSFPARILNDLGEKFFFEELKIPVEKYYHFLEYCNPLGIEDKYLKGKILDVINILKKENKTYQELLKKS